MALKLYSSYNLKAVVLKLLLCFCPLCCVQVLLEDFSSCSGYKFLHDYLLYLERKTSDETREVLRNVVLLIQGLVMAGFLTLEPTITDGGPFQDPGFQIPAPLDPSMKCFVYWWCTCNAICVCIEYRLFLRACIFS